jgi:hypothetical protein
MGDTRPIPLKGKYANEHGQGSGFDRDSANRDLATSLGTWQKAGDPRLFEVIISPEFWRPSRTPGAYARVDVKDGG